jgi:Sec-independent protein translocase protein TatA
MSLAEMFFLGLLALVIFGPKKLASIAPQIGNTLARWKKVSSDFRTQLTTEISATASAQPAKRSTVVNEPAENGMDNQEAIGLR